TNDASLEREKKIVAWLSEIEKDAKAIYLVGDIFDFWFEYKHAIPKGFVRLQGKIIELTEKGIPVHFFLGNHDMWMFDYFKTELGVEIHPNELELVINQKSFYIAHGDGLGPGDKGYKLIKKIFRNRFCQWAFARLHPNFGIPLAKYFSKTSRNNTGDDDAHLNSLNKEWLYQFTKSAQKERHRDYYIFGHRHLPLKFELENTTYFNLGEWLNFYTFGRFNGEQFELLQWKENQIIPFKSISE
ncbi:MAG: UDP-2,3-diacylglucosamine diphosphatase, partial [Bacteroidetes bacterium]|nr:UDP-2,3-diacylglucosamine diphosphatase [Bacteroidota bacterium]